MMWAALRLISVTRPVRSRWNTGVCINRQCLFPAPCKNLNADHSDYVRLLRRLRAIPKVKKVFIRSGIRFDYLLTDKKKEFLKELCEYHVSGQLKVAPEHISDPVLKMMGKPEKAVYLKFVQEFKDMNRNLRQRSVSGSLSDVFPSGIYDERGGRTG